MFVSASPVRRASKKRVSLEKVSAPSYTVSGKHLPKNASVVRRSLEEDRAMHLAASPFARESSDTIGQLNGQVSPRFRARHSESTGTIG